MSTLPKSSLPSPVQLTEGVRLPSFTLKSVIGEEFRLSQVRGRANLALLFLPELPSPADESYLIDVAAAMPEIEEVDSRVLVVTTLNADEAKAIVARTGLNVPVLLDPDRGVYRVYGLATDDGTRAGVFIADRYLMIAAIGVGSSLREAMSCSDLLEWLRYIAFQCSECSDVTSWTGTVA